MAQRIRWQVLFVAIDGTAYTVNIYQEGYNGSPVALNGAATPFYTEEDNSDDPLTPIRTQTGYISIVSDRNTWLSVIKQGDYVTLTADRKTHWCGFISKEAFNSDIFESDIEYQIPVHCVLSHLNSYRFQVSPFDSPTFAQILNESFAKFPIGVPKEFMWSQRVAGNVPEFLECRFQRTNFYNDEDIHTDGENIESESTYFDVVGEICKYFGIILCVQGEAILFRDIKCGNMYAATIQDIEGVEASGASVVRVTSEYDIDNLPLTALEFVSANNQERIVQPVKNVTIEGEINIYENFDGTMPQKAVDDWIDGHVTDIWHTDGDGIRHYRREFDIDLRSGDSHIHTLQEYDHYENNNSILKCFVYPDGRGGEHIHGSHFISKDECPISDVNNKIDYNWKNYLSVSAYNSDFNDPSFGIYGKHNIHLSSGSGSISIYYKTANAYPSLSVKWVWRLRVGRKYWNGSSWTLTPSTFSIGWKPSNPIMECETNRRLGDGYDGVRGFLIPINTSLSGKMSLEMMRVEDSTIINIELDVLEVKYVNKSSAKQNNPPKNVKIESSTGVDCLNKYSQTCLFSTSPYTNGYGAVADFDGIPLHDYNYNYRRLMPEIHRMNSIKNWMIIPLSILEIEIKDSDSLINRYEGIGESEEWPDYSILSVGHDWREGKLKVKLIES